MDRNKNQKVLVFSTLKTPSHAVDSQSPCFPHRGDSDILGAPYRRSLDLRPIYAVVERLVYQPDRADVVAPYEVDAQRYHLGGFGVVLCVDDAFYGILEDLRTRTYQRLSGL